VSKNNKNQLKSMKINENQAFWMIFMTAKFRHLCNFFLQEKIESTQNFGIMFLQ